MGDLGEVLELMHTCDQRWRTLTARFGDWTDPAIDEKGRRREADLAGLPRMSAPPGDPGRRRAPTIREGGGVVWARASGAVRIERADDDWHPRLTVVNGDRAWTVGHDGLTRSNEHDDVPSGPMFAHFAPGSVGLMLEPSRMLDHLRLAVHGRGERLGRVTWNVSASPRRGPLRRFGPPLALPAADRYRFEVDAETGLLVRWEAEVDGQTAGRGWFESMEVDIPIDDDRFVVVSPPGATVQSAVGHPLSLEEAARQVGFTLYAPPRGRGAAPVVATVSAQGRDGAGPYVMVHALARMRPGEAMVVESADETNVPVVDEWQAIDLEGQARLVHTGHLWTAPDGRADLRVRLGDTYCWIRNATDASAAIELARSLTPVS